MGNIIFSIGCLMLSCSAIWILVSLILGVGTTNGMYLNQLPHTQQMQLIGQCVLIVIGLLMVLFGLALDFKENGNNR